MYRKKSDQPQMTIDDFVLPFGGKLSADNRWVKLAKLMPWELVEEIYAAKFKNERPDGNVPIPARVAFGALHIKSDYAFSDELTLEMATQNPYLQYFLGYKEFQTQPLFDSSMMTLSRKRFSAEDIARINEELFKRMAPGKEEPPQDGGNSGTMVLDATCAPADVRYPTDLSLLNECRENIEGMIGSVWDKTQRSGHKTSYNRKKARNAYLKIAKQRKPRRNAIKQAISEQLVCVEKGLADIGRLLGNDSESLLTERQITRLSVIRQVAVQQRGHAENPKKPVPDRIVSLRQPHVRPIVRARRAVRRNSARS